VSDWILSNLANRNRVFRLQIPVLNTLGAFDWYVALRGNKSAVSLQENPWMGKEQRPGRAGGVSENNNDNKHLEYFLSTFSVLAQKLKSPLSVLVLNDPPPPCQLS
jgi:hypothetical protein